MNTMKQIVVYVHGKGGSAREADHFRALLPGYDVVGFDYQASSPWEAKAEFGACFDDLCEKGGPALLIANSIGAFYAMHSLTEKQVKRAFFISPVVDMDGLIRRMMTWSQVSEEELEQRGTVETEFGETLSWEYLQYVRNNLIRWTVPTDILFGENDHLTPYESMSAFSNRIGAGLTVMKNGEHWFHTRDEMAFLDSWLLGLPAFRDEGGVTV